MPAEKNDRIRYSVVEAVHFGFGSKIMVPLEDFREKDAAMRRAQALNQYFRALIGAHLCQQSPAGLVHTGKTGQSVLETLGIVGVDYVLGAVEVQDSAIIALPDRKLIV